MKKRTNIGFKSAENTVSSNTLWENGVEKTSVDAFSTSEKGRYRNLVDLCDKIKEIRLQKWTGFQFRNLVVLWDVFSFG